MRKTRGYWNYENCKLEAKKYLNKKDFKTNSKGAYNASIKYKWIDNICDHMLLKRKSKNFWNLIECKKEANKYKTRSEFWLKSRSAYNKCVKEGWLEIVCLNMTVVIKPKNYWLNKENCRKEALLYNNRTIFSKKSIHCYITSMSNKWLDEICSHMSIVGNKSKRCIYAAIFPDNSVYIGLTSNFNRRKLEHLNGMNKYSNNCKKSSVYKHIEKTKLIPEFVILNDYVDIETAIKLEKSEVDRYRNMNFNILNISKCGSLGGFKKFD